MLNKQQRYWVFSVFLLVLTIVSKIYFLNGLVYKLDYGLFHPDGMLYSFKTLTYLGHSQLSAGKEVANFYLANSAHNSVISPESLFFQNNSNWEIFQLRILYPLLSIPFVYIFGLWGMLVIPGLSFAILWFFTTAKFTNRPIFGIALMIILSASTTVSRWMFANTSDALLVGLFTIYVWLLPRFSKSSDKALIVFHCLFIVTTGLTRFSLLVWAGIALYYLINKKLTVAIMIAIASFLVFLPNFFVNFSGAVLASQSNSAWYEKVLIFPLVLGKMHIVEIGQLFVLDRIFLFGLCYAIWAAFRNRKDSSALLFLFVVTSLILTAGLNGVLGVNFRYHLPLLPFAISFLANHQLDLRTLKK